MTHARLLVLLLLVAIACTPRFACAAAPAPVDANTIDRARALQKSGQLVAAEKLLRDVLAGIDSGKLPANQLGRCLNSLTDIYRVWGRHDDALPVALRYQKFIAGQTALDAKSRDQALEENAVELADIYAGLRRYTEAEKMLGEALDRQPKAGGNPARALTLEVKLARLAAAQDHDADARQRWQTVVEHGAAKWKLIEAGQMPLANLPEIATALVAGNTATENFADAIRVEKSLLAIRVKQQDKPGEIKARTDLGLLYSQTRDYAHARQFLEEALEIQRKLAVNSSDEAELLSALAAMLKAQGAQQDAKQRFNESANAYGQAITREAARDPNSQLIPTLLQQQQNVMQQAGQFRAAIDVNLRLLKMCQQRLGDQHPTTYAVRSDLGALYGAIEDFEQAQPLLVESLDYWRKVNPPNPLRLARALNDLGVVQQASGSLNAARKSFEQALDIRRERLKPDDLRVAYSLNNLASVDLAKGDYAQAIALLESAVVLCKSRGRAAEDSLSNDLLNLAMAYKSQGQLSKASDYCNQALTVYQRAFGADASGAAAYYNSLAQLAVAQSQFDQANQFIRRAVEIQQKNHLDREPIFAATLHQQALISFQKDQFSDAASQWQQALAIQQAAGQTPQAARTLVYLARVATLQNDTALAEKRYRQAIELQATIETHPVVHYLALCNLAEILHGQRKNAEALSLLHTAVKIIETPRSGTTGGETRRAEFFAQFASAYDLLVDWSLQDGKVDEALMSAENGRSRTLLDQLNLAGVDLRDTLSGAHGEQLLARELKLRTEMGSLRARAVNSSAMSDAAAIKALSRQLAQAQDSYAQVWTDIRDASPLYRESLAADTSTHMFTDVRGALKNDKQLMLFYFLGASHSYLLLIAPDDPQAKVFPLVISEPLAAAMSVKAGPLTRPAAVQIVNQHLADMRDRAGGRGLGGIVKSVKGVEAAQQGTLLTETLLPAAVRKLVSDSGAQGVVIVPDGALHQLPFEALLLSASPAPRYVLDVLPPISYAPSANIWWNLYNRPSATRNSPAKLLTVGNPHYLPQTDAPDRPPITMLAATRDAYLGLGGRLPPLPGTAQECALVSRAFAKRQVTQLLADDASEQKVRAAIAGQQFIHIAAHGLVDQQTDNLFGAIALTPSRDVNASADDDGFLSLHEIHGLQLTGCELAVLSACQTNVGPERPLEAGSTLAQAFLAAGAKRVICSHWNVDDRSTAETMGGLFQNLATELDRPASTDKAARRERADYAAALTDAKKRIRNNPQWSSPYYWAPFVLVGPAR